MKKIKVMTIFGTRPEAIKMAPLVKKLNKCPQIEPILCVTAQHRQMLDQVLNIFGLSPDIDLDIMKERQTLVGITVRVLEGLTNVMEKSKPDLVLVHGDTTTTFVAGLSAFYQKISVGHVEAGLRTYNKYFPFPEEMNRKLTGCLTDLHFAPTINNKNNLLNEGINNKNIYITGNTVIDALKTTVDKKYIFKNEYLKTFDFSSKKVIAITAHRRENLGEPLVNICSAIKSIVDSYEDVHVIYPVHLNPVVKETAQRILSEHERIHLIEPLDVQDMHNLIDRSYMVMTDSGGLQEEAPSLGKPVLVLRNETERPEAVKAGTVKIAGTNKDKINELARKLIEDDAEYQKMAKAVNPYGDGNASERILNAILYHYERIGDRPIDFMV